jgi:hypothetical protein
MSSNDYVKVEPNVETFRGYVIALDHELDAMGTIAIPFIAFAKMSGADVDKVFVKEDFERFMDETAQEFGGEVIKHDHFPENETAFSVKTNTIFGGSDDHN